MTYIRFLRIWILLSLIVAASLVMFAASAQALTISATEVIEDLNTNFTSAVLSDLRRTRTTSLGFNNVQNTDATIISENNLNTVSLLPVFGLYLFTDVTYSHLLNWLPAPLPVGGYLTATLKITAFGASGDNDRVIADATNLGTLASTALLSPTTLTTAFNLNIADLADNGLGITINKNFGASGFQAANLVHITKSELTVSYDTAPEPGSLALMGTGLLLIGRWWKKVRRG